MKKITWVILRGGLGNQLFQFYAGLKHSLLNQTKLYLDSNHIKEDFNGLRKFELSNFNLPLDGNFEKYALITQRRDFKKSRIWRRNKNSASKCLATHPRLPIVTDNNFIQAPESAIFEGYFQNVNFFSFLHEDQSLLPKVIKQDNFIFDASLKYSTAAITVRLGDYLKFPDVFGDFPKDYYKRATEEMYDKFGISNFDIYSDDIDFAYKLLTDSISRDFRLNPVRSIDPLYDFFMIANYSHKIIANSSFSWWASFINPDAIVMYMDPWLIKPVNTSMGLDSWHRIRR